MTNNRQLTRAEWLELYSSIRGNGVAYVIRTNQYSGYDGVLSDISNLLAQPVDYLQSRVRHLAIANNKSSQLAMSIILKLTSPIHIFNRWINNK